MNKASMMPKLNILVCEGDRRVLIRLEAWVKAMGESVVVSDDGVSALDIFTKLSPDIVLVTQDLKSMSGLELIKNIKKINPSQAVVFMMGQKDTVHFKDAIDLQVDKYLNKPVEASLLYKAIKDLAQEKLWHADYEKQKRVLQDYKDALDLSFSVTKHDTNGKIFYANKLFCETTKLSNEEAMKGKINPFNNPNADMQQVFDTLEKEHIYRDRQIFLFEDMQDHIIDITAVAMLDEKDEIVEYLVFSNDVSEVVHAARKIKNQEIDKKLQKLNHIKELNQMKDSFLTVFTHELRTPLNTIINFSEYVKKHLSKEEFKKRDILLQQIVEINKSGWHMLEMISNLMEAIKLKDSQLSFDITEFSCSYMMDNVLAKYKQLLSDKSVQKLYQNEFKISSDESRISQILDNLISNAIKYSEKNIAIVLKANETDFKIEVLDDGEGFKDSTKVFELFEQSEDDSLTRTATGTGVGLFIVKQICDKMGYEINILRSDKLGGARVVITGKRDIRV